ncbi:MAG: hypothetical protein KDB27_32805 [Planctomycetales bacterium]|nr:hypothetical protein [Planctomycetales bacterium]
MNTKITYQTRTCDKPPHKETIHVADNDQLAAEVTRAHKRMARQLSLAKQAMIIWRCFFPRRRLSTAYTTVQKILDSSRIGGFATIRKGGIFAFVGDRQDQYCFAVAISLLERGRRIVLREVICHELIHVAQEQASAEARRHAEEGLCSVDILFIEGVAVVLGSYMILAGLYVGVIGLTVATSMVLGLIFSVQLPIVSYALAAVALLTVVVPLVFVVPASFRQLTGCELCKSIRK